MTLTDAEKQKLRDWAEPGLKSPYLNGNKQLVMRLLSEHAAMLAVVEAAKRHIDLCNFTWNEHTNCDCGLCGLCRALAALEALERMEGRNEQAAE